MSQLDYQIIGSDLQMVRFNLHPEQAVLAEPGAMVFMGAGIGMETTTGGGLFSGFKRMLGGAGLFLSKFINQTNTGAQTVSFAAPYPGKVMAVDLSEHGGQLLAQKHCFLCAEQSTEIDIAFTKRFSSGFFGGDGFILQKLMGNDLVFIHAGGSLIKKELKSGEVLKVDTGCLAAFESSVQYQVELVRGMSNLLFGNEGMFFVKLTGPGKVYIQSMPFARLAHVIASMMPNRK